MHEIIVTEIRERGPVSFARFMELALYHPAHGYYEQPVRPIGTGGDFYTSVSVGPLLGELLAARFATWLDELAARQPERETLQLVEAGAHDGRLAADVLQWLRNERPDALERVEYVILEPSPRRRTRQREQLAAFGPLVRWLEDVAQLASATDGVRGVIFSNELLDAFPVHRLGWSASRKAWFEWGVREGSGQLCWVRLPLDGSDAGDILGHLTQLPAELLAVLPDGFTTETCPAAVAWWRTAARSLRAGKLLTMDYGLSALEFLSPDRAGGTLRAFHRHRLTNDLLAQPGGQDLTAHVNFTALQAAGEQAGLQTETLEPQESFLTRIAERRLSGRDGVKVFSPEELRQFRTLTHPAHLGRSFRVLAQSRPV